MHEFQNRWNDYYFFFMYESFGISHTPWAIPKMFQTFLTWKSIEINKNIKFEAKI